MSTTTEKTKTLPRYGTDLLGAALLGAAATLIAVAAIHVLDGKEIDGMLVLLNHLHKDMEESDFEKILATANKLPGLDGKFVKEDNAVVLLRKIK